MRRARVKRIRADKRFFQKTADRTKKINRNVTYRGGIRL